MSVSVFVSYSSADKPFAGRLVTALCSSGVEVWVDEAELRVGDSLISAISAAVHQVDYVIALLSRHSVASMWVKKELALAMTREITQNRVVVLPALLEDCNIPETLCDKVHVDFREPAAFDHSVQRLLAAIEVDGGVSNPFEWLCTDDSENVLCYPYDYERYIACLRVGHRVGIGKTKEEALADIRNQRSGIRRRGRDSGGAT